MPSPAQGTHPLDQLHHRFDATEEHAGSKADLPIGIVHFEVAERPVDIGGIGKEAIEREVAR